MLDWPCIAYDIVCMAVKHPGTNQGRVAEMAELWFTRSWEKSRKARAAKMTKEAAVGNFRELQPTSDWAEPWRHIRRIEYWKASNSPPVLEDGARVLTQRGFLEAIGRSGKPAQGRGSQVEKVAPFLGPRQPRALRGLGVGRFDKANRFLSSRLASRALRLSPRVAPRVCKVYLKAGDTQAHSAEPGKDAKACEILMRSSAPRRDHGVGGRSHRLPA